MRGFKARFKDQGSCRGSARGNGRESTKSAFLLLGVVRSWKLTDGIIGGGGPRRGKRRCSSNRIRDLSLGCDKKEESEMEKEGMA